MKARKQHLILDQTDRKLKPFLPLTLLEVPPKGWIHTIRTSLNMSLRQLAGRVGKKAQTIQEFEQREQNGTITIQSMKDIAEALDMQLVYALVPKKGTLEELIDKKAMEKAKEIVNRTSISMSLEDQENTQERLISAFEEKKNELKNDMPKFLWD